VREVRVSKLLQFKEWLSLEEATRHMSIALTEPVTVADLLRLALDGHLTLSVHLVTYTHGKQGKTMTAAEAGTLKIPYQTTLPEDLSDPDIEGHRKRRDDAPFRGWEELEVLAGQELPDGRVVVFDEFVKRMDGVWDLIMVGGGRIDIQTYFQHLVDGPEVRLVSLNGTLLERPGHPDEVWELQERHDHYLTNPEWVRRREAGEPVDDVPLMLPEKVKGYIQAGGLPEGSTLVVRTAVLNQFLGNVSEATASASEGVIWPNHDTPRLVALRDAAVQFWSTYEEGVTSPPTSKEVAAWLVQKHGVSLQMAEAMAAILRPQGLPPGPLSK
jgi:hypothetical protein